MAYSKGAKSEAELASFMEYRVRALGGDRLAYVPVVASETRGLVLHYTHNNQLLRDWMLMDAGALYFGYCSDITRSWPLNGRFSDPQAKLYEAVLRVQEGCQRAVEGIEKCSFGLLNELAVYLTCEELRRLGFRNVERNVSRWFPHSIGHHLGLDLHDSTDDNQKHPLVPGNVITIEPGLYIPVNDFDAPEEFRGLAIRIEDDFVIGKGGSLTNMTEKVPKTISEIEDLLQ